MQSNISPDKEIYTCKKCCKRKDNDYYLRNNLHPVWFQVNEDGSYKLDEAGKKILHFEIPQELKDLQLRNDSSLEDVPPLYLLFIYPILPLR
jgi:hypothetical protein